MNAYNPDTDPELIRLKDIIDREDAAIVAGNMGLFREIHEEFVAFHNNFAATHQIAK